MSHFSVLVIGDNPEEQLAPFQENNMGDCPENYLEFNEDDDFDVDEKTGKKGYWENPNAKWDWYQLGGRWTGFFKLKKYGEGITGSPGLLTPPAGIGYVDRTLKKHIDLNELNSTFAVLKDGKWYEKGKMSLLDILSGEDQNKWNEEFKKLIEEIDDDVLLSVYDCHI